MSPRRTMWQDRRSRAAQDAFAATYEPAPRAIAAPPVLRLSDEERTALDPLFHGVASMPLDRAVYLPLVTRGILAAAPGRRWRLSDRARETFLTAPASSDVEVDAIGHVNAESDGAP